jgi:hypothetical protein
MIDIDTNAAIALKEPLDISPDFLLEGKKEPFLYYYPTSDLHPLLYDERMPSGCTEQRLNASIPI